MSSKTQLAVALAFGVPALVIGLLVAPWLLGVCLGASIMLVVVPDLVKTWREYQFRRELKRAQRRWHEKHDE